MNRERFSVYLRKLNTPLIAWIVLLIVVLGLGFTLYQNIQIIGFAKPSSTLQSTYRPASQVNIRLLNTVHLMGIPLKQTDTIPLARLGYTVKAILLKDNGEGRALISILNKDIMAKVNTLLAPGITVRDCP